MLLNLLLTLLAAVPQIHAAPAPNTCEARLLAEAHSLFPFASERLVLKLSSLEDGDAVRPMLSDPEFLEKYLLQPSSRRKPITGFWQALFAERVIQEHLCVGAVATANRLKMQLVAYARESGELIGVASVTRHLGHGHWEISFAIRSEFRRQGYALEIVKSLVERVRHCHPDAIFWSQILPTNGASAATLTKAGFQPRPWPKEKEYRAFKSEMYELAP